VNDPLLPHLELLAQALVPVPEVPVSISRSFLSDTGRVLVAGELLTADRARALAGKLVRAADQLDRLLA
jgi:hypothetical protein